VNRFGFIFLLSVFLLSIVPQRVLAGCSGTCKWCGQYNNIPCGNWTCTSGGNTNSDKINKLPTGTIKNSSLSDADGCPDNYPAAQTSLPFTVNGVTYKTLPTTVSYSTNTCVCQ